MSFRLSTTSLTWGRWRNLSEHITCEHFGPAVWRQRERAVEKLWNDIRPGIDALHLDYREVRIYQDGLPVCGKEEHIVRELAGAGSLNHQLVLELMGKGAVLVGTEDPQLLIREYQLQRRRIGARAPAIRPLPRCPTRQPACWRPVICSLPGGLQQPSRTAKPACCSWGRHTASTHFARKPSTW